MGKALDISRGGMLIETPDPIPAGRLSLMAVDKDNVLFEIQAELVYCNEIHPGIFQAGIKFTGTQLQVIDHVTRLIKEYSYRKKYLHIDRPQWE